MGPTSIFERWTRGRLAFGLLLGVLLGLGSQSAWPSPSARDTHDAAPSEVAAGGRLIWDSADELDLVGDLWASLPWISPWGGRLRLDTDLRTAIRGTRSDLAFIVRDVVYRVEAAWIPRALALRRSQVEFFVGQQGLALTDEEGDLAVRHAGLGWSSSRYHRFTPEAGGHSTSLRVGRVFDQRSIDADWTVEGAARAWAALGPGPGGRAQHLGFDLRVAGVVEGDRPRLDVSAGPRYALSLDDGITASLFLHWQRSRNPLGLGHDAWLMGFEYARGPRSGSPAADTPAPTIDGAVAVAAGTQRRGGELRVRFRSPPAIGAAWVVAEIDAHLLGADDTHDLYYLYHVGGERPWGSSVAGVYFFHRSNHQLGRTNETVTSINVMEFGMETPDWARIGTRTHDEPRGSWDARARVGLLLDSDFGRDRRWHVRGGVRYSLPILAGARPYAAIEVEAGDVRRQSYAVGSSLTSRLELQLEYRRDQQYFSRERGAWLVVARHGF